MRTARGPKPLWFFDASLLTEREKANPRFPRASPALMRTVIETTCLAGEYSGSDIVSTLNKIRDELNDRLLRDIRKYDTGSVIMTSCRILDELYSGAMRTEWKLAQLKTPEDSSATIMETKHIMQAPGWLGQPLERILETALVAEPNSLHRQCTTSDLIELFELASEMAWLHYVMENFRCLWGRGRLLVTDSNWDFDPDREDRERAQRITERLASERNQRSRNALGIESEEQLSPIEFQKALWELHGGRKSTKLGDDLDEFILAVDEPHRSEFGCAFSERVLALFVLAENHRELRGDWAFADRVEAFLCKQLHIDDQTAQSILNVLSLTGDAIAQEGDLPFHLRRKYRLTRRPLPRFTVGRRSVVFLSPALIARGVMNLFAEYQNGSHPELESTPLHQVTQRLNQRNADYFVSERVAKPLHDLGLVVKVHTKRIDRYNLPALKVGEIDILAFKPGIDKLIVGECKFSALSDVHVSQMRRDITDYLEESTGYADRLRHKLNWVAQHSHVVLEHLGVREAKHDLQCVPVFFTNYYTPASEYVTDIQFVTENELAKWCKAMV